MSENNPGNTSFNDLMAGVERGDEQACGALFNRFAQRLVGLARSKMSSGLRRKDDPEDVMQSVFKSFFAKHAEGRFEFENWESLWGMLVVITMRKCGKRVDTWQAACRDFRRESTPAPAGDQSSGGWEAVAREPSPLEVVMLAETVEQLLQGLGERERQIMTLRLQGYSIAEISTEVGRSERTVHRVVEQAREKLLALRARDGDSPAEEC